VAAGGGRGPLACFEAAALWVAAWVGWLRGASSKWEFHADVQNPRQCHIVSGPQPASQMGFCCRDA
jgi:hypothetical protein